MRAGKAGAKSSLPPREERPGYKATFGTRGGQTVNRGLHAEELRNARQIMVNRGRHDYSKLVPSFKPQAKPAAVEAKATAIEKQATQDYGRNPKLAEAGFAAAKKLRAEATGRDQQLFSGPPKRAEKGDRSMRLADAREGLKVRAANRAYTLAKEQGIPTAERVRGSEYRNLRADVLKQGRAALARSTPDAGRRIEAQNKLAESRLPDRFPLFLKNPATSQPKPTPKPSLREQADASKVDKRQRPAKSDRAIFDQASRVRGKIGKHIENLAAKTGEPSSALYNQHAAVMTRENQLKASKERAGKALPHRSNGSPPSRQRGRRYASKPTRARPTSGKATARKTSRVKRSS